MKTPKLIINYAKLKDKQLATLATRTIDALRDNTNFPDLYPSFEDYEAAALDYLNKHGISSKRGSMLQNEEKDEARKLLIDMMRRVTSYINNETKISSVQLSSGFHPVAPAQAGQVPDSSTWARLRDSKRPDEILLQFEAVHEAYEYELQIASELEDNGEPIWQDLGTVSNSLGNFYAPVVDGVVYYFRVRSRNKHGISHWSPVASLRARA